MADYASLGLTLGRHPMALVRPELARSGVRSAHDLIRWRHGQLARAAGLVTHRQRPATASGLLFVSMEDETGMINVIVRPDLYEAERSLLRADPLLVVHGRLERRERVVNVLAKAVEPARLPARDPVPLERPADTRVRAAVPMGQNFAQGRR